MSRASASRAGLSLREPFCSPVFSKPQPAALPGLAGHQLHGEAGIRPLALGLVSMAAADLLQGPPPSLADLGLEAGGRKPRKQSWEQGAQGCSGGPEMVSEGLCVSPAGLWGAGGACVWWGGVHEPLLIVSSVCCRPSFFPRTKLMVGWVCSLISNSQRNMGLIKQFALLSLCW